MLKIHSIYTFKRKACQADCSNTVHSDGIVLVNIALETGMAILTEHWSPARREIEKGSEPL
jgi:hypothetical protein